MATKYGTGLATATKSNPAGTSGTEANTSTAQDALGRIMFAMDETYGEKMFMYVKASGAITKGQSVIFTGAPYVVKADTTSAKRGRIKIAGVAMHSFTDAYYGWIQIRGYNTVILAAPALSTSACTWTLYVSGGVFSINKCLQKCGCTIPQSAGVFTYSKVAAGKSTSGFINCWSGG